MHKFILKFDNRSFLLKLEDKNEIEVEISKKLKDHNIKIGNNLRIYAHDSDLGDFYEVDSSEDLPDGGILKLEFDNDSSNDSIDLDDNTNHRYVCNS